MSCSTPIHKQRSSARSRKPVAHVKSVLKPNMTHESPNYIMVFDTETTGLFPRNANPENFELFNNARMVEIAWEIYTQNGELVNRESYLIKPNGFVIPDTVIAIHGINNEMAHNNGVNIQNVFERLQVVLKDVAIIVAHNFQYDNGIILSELYRLNSMSDRLMNYTELINNWGYILHKCTMIMGTHITGRWTKLSELYNICFNTYPTETLHRAAADVGVCAKVYFYLVTHNVNNTLIQ